MNKILILILSFLFWGVVSSAQKPCTHFEEKMKFYFNEGHDLSTATTIFEDYMAEDCSDKLLAYNFIGFVYYNLSNFQKAKEYFILGENVYFENEKNITQFVVNQMYTGLILIAEKDFESAKYHLNKANKWVQKVDDEFIKGMIFQNIGLVKVETNDLDEAEVYFIKAINTRGLDSTSIGYIYQNLAFLNLKRNNTKKTKEFIQRAKDIWNKLDYSKGIYLLSFLEAKQSIEEKQFNQALDYLQNGRSVYDVDNKLLAGENYLIEANIQDSLGNKQAQLIALEKAVLESEDLTEMQLKEAVSQLTELQDVNKTNIVLSDLVSKLKDQNLNQKKIDLKRNRIMDYKSDKDQSTIKMQLKYLVLFGSIILLLSYLSVRIIIQKRNIEMLNYNLSASKLEIENKVERLKQKNKDLEQFAYVASHDLRSPLRTISSFAGLLKKKIGVYDEKGYLEIIISSAKNMSAMITDLLKYSTLDQNLNISVVNLKDLIDNTINTIITQVSESNCNIRVDESCNQSIHCDKILFSNVIQNIISNSIKYCKTDVYPEIDISTKELNDKIEISITDNGIGIDEEYLDKVFEMFSRLKTKDIDGTGIGLSTCKKIVEKHKGTITVNAKSGVGSTFIISIPSHAQFPKNV